MRRTLASLILLALAATIPLADARSQVKRGSKK